MPTEERQLLAEAETAKWQAQKQAFHLGGVGVVGIVQRPQRAAAGQHAIDQSQHDAATRGRVVAR